MCWKGVWDDGIGRVNLESELCKLRGKLCFHIKHSPSMSYQGADQLMELRRARIHIVVSVIACAVSVLALALSALAFTLSLEDISALFEFP